MGRALVLVSGGLDSTVALWWALDAGHEVVPLTFHYPGRPRGEARATREVVALAGLREPVEAALPFLEEAADADARLGESRFQGAPPGYVPARNALFYAAAAHQAQVHGCGLIVGGHHAEDAREYPDASASFFSALERLLAASLWRGPAPPRLAMPLLELDRDEVVALGARLGAPMDLTWSCYEDREAPCGACPACARRGELALGLPAEG